MYPDAGKSPSDSLIWYLLWLLVQFLPYLSKWSLENLLSSCEKMAALSMFGYMFNSGTHFGDFIIENSNLFTLYSISFCRPLSVNCTYCTCNKKWDFGKSCYMLVFLCRLLAVAPTCIECSLFLNRKMLAPKILESIFRKSAIVKGVFFIDILSCTIFCFFSLHLCIICLLYVSF